MPIEIEKKYTINPTLVDLSSAPFDEIYQGYLHVSESVTIRVRTKGEKAFLTIKGASNNISRKEFEYQIPVQEAKDMLENLAQTSLIKNRYYLTVGTHLWEIDEFLGRHKGLWLAEIELNDETEEFEKPEWLIEDVSTNFHYTNAYLSQQ